jgi:hypothetical protein
LRTELLLTLRTNVSCLLRPRNVGGIVCTNPDIRRRQLRRAVETLSGTIPRKLAKSNVTLQRTLQTSGHGTRILRPTKQTELTKWICIFACLSEMFSLNTASGPQKRSLSKRVSIAPSHSCDVCTMTALRNAGILNYRALQRCLD